MTSPQMRPARPREPRPAHAHDWIETTRWCDTNRIWECRCGATREEAR